MENMTHESAPYRSGDYSDFFEASATQLLTNEEAVAYSQSYFKELENQSAVRFAADRSREEGWKEGRMEGLNEGIAMERERIIESARKAGFTEDMIARLLE